MENGSVLEAMLGSERADALVSFIATDMAAEAKDHYGDGDEIDVFDEVIDSCIGENPIVQLIQMSDDDAISELGMRIAVQLEMTAREAKDRKEAKIVSRLAIHYANWLMAMSPEDYEDEPEDYEEQ